MPEGLAEAALGGQEFSVSCFTAEKSVSSVEEDVPEDEQKDGVEVDGGYERGVAAGEEVLETKSEDEDEWELVG